MAAAVLCLAAQACADRSTTAPVLVTGCGSAPFLSSVFDGPAEAERGDDAAAVQLRRVITSRDAGVSFPPGGGWRLLSRTAGTVAFGTGTPPYLDGYIVLQEEQGEWRIAASGDRCTIEPHIPGRAIAVWQVDLGAGPPPGKEATSVASL